MAWGQRQSILKVTFPTIKMTPLYQRADTLYCDPYTEDLELSVRNDIWTHSPKTISQPSLSDTAKFSHPNSIHWANRLSSLVYVQYNVALIFSANKAGGYISYARMRLHSTTIQRQQSNFSLAQVLVDSERPKIVSSSVIEFAPKRRNVVYYAQGLIFWEADRDEFEKLIRGRRGGGRSDQRNTSKAFIKSFWTLRKLGKAFNLESLSTSRLPFIRPPTQGCEFRRTQTLKAKPARASTSISQPATERMRIGLFSPHTKTCRITHIDALLSCNTSYDSNRKVRKWIPTGSFLGALRDWLQVFLLWIL